MSPTEQTEPTATESPAAPAQVESSNDSQAASPAQSANTETSSATPAPESATAGSASPADQGREGGEKKKRRRRRRKKKGDGTQPGDAQAAQGEGGDSDGEGDEGEGEGEAHEGEGAAAKPEGAHAKAEGGEGKKKRNKKKKPREGAPTRERPAFNVSDVVFGKIIEITDDVIFVDLSGKAKAIFDKLELVIPEDSIDVEDEARRSEELAESIVAGTIGPEAAAHADPSAAAPAEGEAPAATADESQSPRGKIIRIVRPSGEEAAPAEGAAPEGQPPVEAAPADANAEPAEAAPAAEAPAVAAEGEAPAAASAETTPSTPEASEEKSSVLQLPRVVLEPGAPFVGVVRNDGARGGLVVLTHHPHRASKSKPVVAAAFKKKEPINGLVTGVIKGGVEVDVDGVRAFAPGSQVELRLGADLHHLVGKRLPFMVTHYAKRGRDVIVSRRSMLETEAKAAREAALSRLKVGDTIEGTVRSVVPFGAFVDLGGIDGLVPLTEMSHNRGDRPSDVFKVNEKVSVLIQKIDDKGKVSLSRKATLPDPWGDAAKKYALGTRHTGKVVRIREFGAFIELEPAIDGLIHAADLSFKRIEKPEDVVKVGDAIEVVVASVDSSHQKIGLHPALTGAQAEEPQQKVEVGRTVKAEVVAVETGGLLMRVQGVTGRSARAFMPASATDTPRGTELRKLFPPGHVMDAKVIEKDPRRGEVKLSIRALKQETERNAYQQYRQQVKREAKFGTFADLLAKKNPQK